MAATASADGPLAVTISAPDTGVEGTPVPFTVPVTNTTADTTTSLSQVDIDLSSNSQLSGGTTNSTGGACTRRTSPSGTTMICNLAGIPADGTATLSLSALPLATGTLSVTATAAFAVTLSQASVNLSIAAAPTDVQ